MWKKIFEWLDERLGLNELGYGYTGKDGATMRRYVESVVNIGCPRVDIPGGRPHYPQLPWAMRAVPAWLAGHPTCSRSPSWTAICPAAAAAAHGVLSGAAVERISKSVMDKVVITDTISPRPDVLAEKRIKVVTVAELIAQAIRRTHREESISSLFD